MRQALIRSRNIPAVKAFQENSKKNIMKFVQGLGITPEIKNDTIHEAHALGAFNGSNPLELAAAYAAFGNGGYYIEPYSVTKIVYDEDNSEETFEPVKTRAMSDSTAFMITDMLRSGIDSGYIGGGRISGVQYAAKTGTSNFDDETKAAHHLSSEAINDLWEVGFDQDYAIGMWVGYEKISDGHHTTNNWGDRTALWNAIARGIFEKTGKTFTAPNSVVKVDIVKGSEPYKLANEYTPKDMIISEYFKKGTEPTDTDTSYIKIPDVSGLSANNDNGKITLSWTTPTMPDTSGLPTYTIYQDGTKIGSTDQSSYKVTLKENKKYTFTVKVSYSNLEGIESAGVSTTVDLTPVENTNDIVFKLNGDKVMEIVVGSTFTDPGIFVLDGNDDATSKATVVITPDSIDTSTIGTHTITYQISYKGKKETFTRTVKVIEDSSSEENSSTTPSTEPSV